jgi:hypothetical protein
MMLHGRIYRFDKQLEQIREVIEAACAVLRQPMPDTFLGRKTQEPFPKENELPPPKAAEVASTFPIRDAGS